MARQRDCVSTNVKQKQDLEGNNGGGNGTLNSGTLKIVL